MPTEPPIAAGPFQGDSTRREFLAALVALLGASADATTADPALAQLARTLFPHATLEPAHYDDIAVTIHAAVQYTPGLADALMTFVPKLDHAAGGAWRALGADARIAVVAAVADEPEFAIVRDAALAAVYRHPAVWRLVGYGGSSFESGGYLGRGFDRVDWLPNPDPP